MQKNVRRCFQTLKKYLSSIENRLTYTLSNGIVEGTNNKIKNIERSGYGYRVLICQTLTEKKRKKRPLLFEEEKAIKNEENLRHKVA